MSRYVYRRRRRGVLLLVMLSVLVLFLLLTLTFVIVAGRERTAARALARAELAGDPPFQVCDSLMMMLLRDTNDVHSPFRSHSLLEGIYGNVSFRGRISSSGSPVVAQAQGQILALQPDTSVAPFTGSYFNTTQNYYKGCVLTMINGPCAGLSTRITGSDTLSGTFTIRVMRFKSDPGTAPAYSGNNGAGILSVPNLGDWFLINGRPYCGMGRGYNLTSTNVAGPSGSFTAGTPVNNATDPNGWLYALLPNTAQFSANGAYTDPAGPGGVNTDETSYDLNNFYMGLIVPNGAGGINVLPSFHRGELVAYWAAQQSAANQAYFTKTPPYNCYNDPNAQSATNLMPVLLRKIMARPNAYDNPLFTSSTNPNFNPQSPTGPFDVDNLGQGVPDSVWIDPGLPVFSKDGRTYKILVAPLILDMDGRINVNAHGSVAQVDAMYNGMFNYNPPQAPTPGTLPYFPGTMADGSTGTYLPLGQGWGAADVNLLALLPPTDVANIIQGNPVNTTSLWQGRHGRSNTPFASILAASPTKVNGLLGVKFFEYPFENYNATGMYALTSHAAASPYTLNAPDEPLSSFGNPCDLRGRRAIALDPRGQPMYLTYSPSGTINWDISNGTSPYISSNSYLTYELGKLGETTSVGPTYKFGNPYGMDLSQRLARPGREVATGGVDNPFTTAEFERVMRQYDVDARDLPPRLFNLLQSGEAMVPNSPGVPNPNFNPDVPNAITSDSADLPVPNLQAPRDLRPNLAGNGYRAFQITDLVRAALSKTAVPAANYDAEIAALLPPELIAGLRMDINRPLGNNHFDACTVAAASVVAETAWSNIFSATGAPSTAGAAITLNMLNGVQTNGAATDVRLTRQLMARQLYTLMMLFTDQGYVTWTTEAGLTAAQQQEITTRRVAQWAINVVCFRDNTSIMTPFEYQSDIFTSTYSGWKVDGDPGTDEGPTGLNTIPGRRIVWGCKPPDLMLMETFAFHDRRVADTNVDNGPKKKRTDQTALTNPDPTLDQVRIPQGSLFIKLYCPRNPNNFVAPTDLYYYTGGPNGPPSGQWALDLGRMSKSDTGSYPVWRMVISQSTKASPNNDVATAATNHPDSILLEPNNMSMLNVLGSGLPAVGVDRVIWLGRTNPPVITAANAAAVGNIYFNRNSPAPGGLAHTSLLPLGSYAVVGPRATTYIGSTLTTPGTSPWGTPGTEKITLTPNTTFPTPAAQVGCTTISGTAFPTATNIKNPLAIIAAAYPPAIAPNLWSNTVKTAPNGIGLNISEPVPNSAANNYYTEPTGVDLGTGLTDIYGPSLSAGQAFLDGPLDSVAGMPLKTDNILATGTTSNYKTVFLQRLADPTQEYDPAPGSDALLPAGTGRNPYITVDWMPIDLTVFNGEDRPPATWPPAGVAGPWDPDDPSYTSASRPAVRFASRMRGTPSLSTPTGTLPRQFDAVNNLNNPWTPASDVPPTTPVPTPAPAATINFPFCLDYTQGIHALGFLNPTFAPAYTTATAPTQQTQTKQYVGDSNLPFPWITWNARPYASLMELLLVPASSPERLLLEYSFIPPSGTTPNPYDPTQTATTNPPGSYKSPYGHLLNFFQSSTTPGAASNYYRALEYLQVPSRFIGTDTVLNPANFNAAASVDPTATSYFRPPFNMVSNYRDFGRININTITYPEVWNALLNGLPGPTFSQLIDSRCGYGAGGGLLINPNSAYPTMFSNPFRAPAGADAVPLASMVHQRDVNVTLLRGAGTSGTSPTIDASTTPLFYNLSTSAYNDTNRNPYFHYQTLERLSNNVTTHSNVFAVWLTIGYFQAIPNPAPSNGNFNHANGGVDAGHPDGYMLGPELGSESGSVERHRAFYIIDRSIPVGYERGQNHNTDRAILSKRFIE